MTFGPSVKVQRIDESRVWKRSVRKPQMRTLGDFITITRINCMYLHFKFHSSYQTLIRQVLKGGRLATDYPL